MPLFDFACPLCGRIESDVLIRTGHALDVDCLACLVPMLRRIGVPAPAIFERGGTGAGRAS